MRPEDVMVEPRAEVVEIIAVPKAESRSLGLLAVHVLAGAYADVRPLVDENFPAIVQGLALLEARGLAVTDELATLGEAAHLLVTAFSLCSPAEQTGLLRLAGLGPRHRNAAIAFLMAQAAS